jgi:hypothetical protein
MAVNTLVGDKWYRTVEFLEDAVLYTMHFNINDDMTTGDLVGLSTTSIEDGSQYYDLREYQYER